MPDLGILVSKAGLGEESYGMCDLGMYGCDMPATASKSNMEYLLQEVMIVDGNARPQWFSTWAPRLRKSGCCAFL